MNKIMYAVLVACWACTTLVAQDLQRGRKQDYLQMRWGTVATGMPSHWYGSKEASLVAENVLISQKDIGGWVKNQPYHHPFSDSLRNHYIQTKGTKGGTFDNGATITELRFLAKVYAHHQDERYRQAFDRGLDYIFMAQYENGGWPQFYPVKDQVDETFTDKIVPYSMHITFNDNAMVNTLNFLKDVFSGNADFAALQIDQQRKDRARAAFSKGIDCILQTQIVVDHQPTVWCAQHHYITLMPVKARAYELESFSGGESVDIVSLLMNIDHPSDAVIAAVNGACSWFESHQIAGLKVIRRRDTDGIWNTAVVYDQGAPPIWARFYDLDTQQPYFCDRDGIKRATLDEIGAERRNGYSWYTNAPQGVLDRYPEWSRKWSRQKNALKR